MPRKAMRRQSGKQHGGRLRSGRRHSERRRGKRLRGGRQRIYSIRRKGISTPGGVRDAGRSPRGGVMRHDGTCPGNGAQRRQSHGSAAVPHGTDKAGGTGGTGHHREGGRCITVPDRCSHSGKDGCCVTGGFTTTSRRGKTNGGKRAGRYAAKGHTMWKFAIQTRKSGLTQISS